MMDIGLIRLATILVCILPILSEFSISTTAEIIRKLWFSNILGVIEIKHWLN